jgi:hypothetical protein
VRIILRWMLRKRGVRDCTGFIWLRNKSSVMRTKITTPNSTKCGELLDQMRDYHLLKKVSPSGLAQRLRS